MEKIIYQLLGKVEQKVAIYLEMWSQKSLLLLEIQIHIIWLHLLQLRKKGGKSFAQLFLNDIYVWLHLLQLRKKGGLESISQWFKRASWLSFTAS